MSDSATDTTITLDPAPAPQDAEATAEQATDGETVAAPERLDSPIERVDLTAAETFIPEAVDQLLAQHQPVAVGKRAVEAGGGGIAVDFLGRIGVEHPLVDVGTVGRSWAG